MAVVLYGGELAAEIAERVVVAAKGAGLGADAVNMSDFKKCKLGEEPQTVIFIVQSVENDEPPESAGSCIRFIKKKANAADMFSKMKFSVLGLGDSNLLLDRQTTTAKDCNKVGQAIDKRIEELGGSRICDLGLADERTGLTEVEPYLETLIPALKEALA
uniref:Flavodoxin-like domain-containing protein n=1 Tax=Hemiselmis andersenii TaxID=464988 RepID=A0A6U5BBM7_HEMAN|mmetsp:Transcript_9309/g.21764  ORF Transcript_9309/g.21764 Transcript_9309/m.21764 type:complete len:160 (+) Transcript_9309:104-583(+)|eukprot:CAMPEP_0172055174 /NCGR_PEP_ID=MMETSP1043-20130122/5136_1 /TAXON_ID=464988 /ORGANISM="Hemiselmis andersenii, Strain CCMP441" /LENGTH=159 /DNA_ID=CAMNT_0012714547 /DNA_START=69 /DNA_END=548 /DNA_ORIENTATION=-